MDKALLRRYAPFALLFVGFLLVFSTRSQRAVPLVGSLNTVLPSYGQLRVSDQKVEAEERRIAGMTDYVARVYWKDSTVAFQTYVGYYDRQSQGHSMHSPRNCMPGAGWEILRADTGSIVAAGTRYVVNKYLLKNGPTQAVVFYWYQGRGRVVANEYTVKWNLLRDAAFKGHTEEALVRILIPIAPGIADDSGVVAAAALGQNVGARVLMDVARVLPTSGSGAPRTNPGPADE